MNSFDFDIPEQNSWQKEAKGGKKRFGVKRSFDSTVVETDKFYSLPDKAQALYLHLQMNTDSKGFIFRAEQLTKAFCNNRLDNLKRLINEGYILPVAAHVYVMTHWRVNTNFDTKNDRDTQFQDEFQRLTLDESTRQYKIMQS